MRKKLTTLFFDNSRIILLVFLIIFTTIIATFSTYQKKINKNKFNDLISNTYLKKTLREIVNNLEPKYKTYNHRIKSVIFLVFFILKRLISFYFSL